MSDIAPPYPRHSVVKRTVDYYDDTREDRNMKSEKTAPDLSDRSVHSLTVKEAAAVFGCSTTNAYQRVADGSWPTVAVGRRKFVPASFIRRQLDIETKS